MALCLSAATAFAGMERLVARASKAELSDLDNICGGLLFRQEVAHGRNVSK
jgi:hypothetical protein